MFYFSKAALPYLKKNKGANIVNNASVRPRLLLSLELVDARLTSTLRLPPSQVNAFVR